jgi:predicted transcriptional regulator
VTITVRLTESQTEALRQRAALEQRSMQNLAREAIREYIDRCGRAELLDQVLHEELPRYAEALEQLGQ